jgi:hypothetical protein
MAGPNQIIGGEFQDFEGAVLANNYLTMQLPHDASARYGAVGLYNHSRP